MEFDRIFTKIEIFNKFDKIGNSMEFRFYFFTGFLNKNAFLKFEQKRKTNCYLNRKFDSILQEFDRNFNRILTIIRILIIFKFNSNV